MSDQSVLTLDQAVAYTGYAKSYIYKLTSRGILPYSKPNGKKIFFEKQKLDNWLLGNKILTPAKASEREVCHG